MNTMEISYVVLVVICFGSMAIYAYAEYRKGKAKMLQRRKDEIRRKEELRKKAPKVYKEIYGRKRERGEN